MSRSRRFLVRMALFLVLVAALAVALGRSLVVAFMGNPGVNGVILGILVAGIVYIFRQVLLLKPEIDWIESFRHREAGGEEPISRRRPAPRLLAPMARMLGARQGGRVSLSASSMQTLLDGIGSRLSETRETSRYLIGVLVFLGLLGTFYGLLETVRSVGGVIGGLNVGGNDLARAFANLKSGLEIAAGRDGDRVQLVAVRARRQPRAGLSRPAGGPGAEPLLQRSRRVAVDLYAALGRRPGRRRRRLGPGLYPGVARADRGQPGKPAAHPRAAARRAASAPTPPCRA